MRSIAAWMYHRFSFIIESVYDALGDDRDGLAVSRRGLLFGNLSTSVVTVLTSGLFFTGLLLNIMQGQSDDYKNRYLGLITIFTTAAGLSQILSPILMERMKKRKTFLLVVRAVYHLLNIGALGLIPFINAAMEVKLWLFIGVIIVMNVITAFCGPAFSVWHMSSCPEHKRANFFSVYHMIIPVVNAVTVLLGSMFIDRYEDGADKLWGILILRGAAVIFAVAEMLMFMLIREPEYESTNARPGIVSIFRVPLRTPRYLKSVAIGFIWTFSASIMGQFYLAYLLDSVKVSYTLYSLMGTISIPVLLLATPFWTRYVKRHSWLRTLYIAVGLYSFAYVMNLFVVPQTVYFYTFIVFFCNLIAPGINLVFAHIPYMNMPKQDQTNYISFYSAMASLAGLLGSAFGRWFIGATEGKMLNIAGIAMQNRQYMNMIPFVLLWGMVLYVRHVKKTEAAGRENER